MSNLDFIAAKVRGMRGKLYENDALRRLCQQPNIEELAAHLAPDQPIGSTIALQRFLTTQHVADLYRVHILLDGWHKQISLWMLRRYQVENLKVLLRCWNSEADSQTHTAFTAQLPDPLALPTDQLMAASSLEELLHRIPIPQLSQGALRGLGDFEESGRLFYVEAGIDQAYLTELLRLADTASGPGAQHTAKLVRLELDIYNVMLVLRAVFNYSLNFNKLRTLFAPLGPRIGLDTLENLRSATDADHAAQLIPATLIGRRSGPLTGDDAETTMWNVLYRTANRLYYASILDFGTVAAFYYIKRTELANLIKISELIRYGLPADLIPRQLIASQNALERTA